MPTIRRQTFGTAYMGVFVVFAIFCLSPIQLIAAQDLPSELSDQAFWKLVSDFSEPGGYFRSDNFVSNEVTFQWVIGDLKRNTKAGGAYLGVGPDQNFTYIVALQPKIAFIVDIRRQNMLQHLMYKALFELSGNRADFLTRLFSRNPKTDVGPNSTPEELFAAFERVPADHELFMKNLQAIKQLLEEDHGITLSNADQRSLDYVFRAFFVSGPRLNYDGPMNSSRTPSYADLMIQTDETGKNHSYMSSEENFRSLQELERKNLIVPLVGDFAGPTALASVAEYLKEHSAIVTAFYTSNVEQYLFQQTDDWNGFYKNVALLPMDSTSTFIRSAFNSILGRYPSGVPGVRSVQVLSSIPDLLKAYDAGQIRAYYDVLLMSK